MVDLSPGTALLAALQGQFNAARQGQGQGTNALIPGLAGQGTDPGSVVGGLGGGISAGGVPGTATSGQSIANSLIGGGGAGGDPLAQQVASFGGFGGRDGPSDPSGASLGEFDNLQGGNRDVLMSILSGNPILMAAAIAQAVNGQNFTFGNDFASGSESQSQSLQNSLDTQPGGFSTNQSSTPLSSSQAEQLFNQTGRTSIAREIEERNVGGSGASPNRGTVSNAGR